MYYTYVIQSKKDSKWYTGCTNDLRKRFKGHNEGKNFSTKGRGPFELIYYEACLNKEDTLNREKYLKSGQGKRYLKNRLKRFRFLTGFTIVEILVVLSIMAVLAAAAGFSIYASRRNDLMLEQAAQNLVSEIRLAYSKATAIQSINTNGSSFIPKAAIIKISTGGNPEISYLKPADTSDPNIDRCDQANGALPIPNKTIPFEGGASVKNIVYTSGSGSKALNSVYLVYTSPIGRFYATDSKPSFKEGANNTCIPNSADWVNNNHYEKIRITLGNGGPRSFNIEVARDSGGATILSQ